MSTMSGVLEQLKPFDTLKQAMTKASTIFLVCQKTIVTVRNDVNFKNKNVDTTPKTLLSFFPSTPHMLLHLRLLGNRKCSYKKIWAPH